MLGSVGVSSLGEVCEDECSFLRRQLVFLLPGLLQQLLPHDGEDRTQQSAAKDLRGLVAWETVAKLRHVTVAQPPATAAQKTQQRVNKEIKPKMEKKISHWCCWELSDTQLHLTPG